VRRADKREASGQPVDSRLEAVGYLFDGWQGLSGDIDRYVRMKDFEIAPNGALTFCQPQVISYHRGERAKNLKRLVEQSTTVDTRPTPAFGGVEVRPRFASWNV